jgi:Uma2 family endonuclease
MAAALKLKMTYAEYDAFEAGSDRKHEYIRGEVFEVLDMAGATPRHGALISSTITELRVRLRGRPCQVFDSSARVRIDATDTDTYPDITVVCGRRQHPVGQPNTTLNPSLLVEVLSPSIEAWDRGGKFAHYRQLPSLQHYVMVSQEEQRVEVYTRQPDGAWMLQEASAGHVQLERLGIELSVDEIYAVAPDETEEVGPA